MDRSIGGRVALVGLARVRDDQRASLEDAMLELRPNCERCDVDLPPESSDARICSFECTFCRPCVEGPLGGRCPNCGGELVARPRRPAEKLERFPASTKRVRAAAPSAAPDPQA
jgi:hypothetical protein